MKRHLTVLQPTPFCNINCTYCHLPMRNTSGRMSHETLRSAIRFVLHGGLDYTEYMFLWHAGEPTTLGIDFYRTATSIIAEEILPGQVVTQGIQTNGTLISPEWIELFRAANFEIGVSIDGPKFLTDRQRVRRNGTGTYEDAIAGLRMLLSSGARVNVIAVLTLDSMNYPNEIYDWCIEEGISSIAFNPEETEGVNSTSLSDPTAELKYAMFLSRIFERSRGDEYRLKIRELTGCHDRIMNYTKDSGVFNHQIEPWAIISIDYKGDVSSFSPELIGNKDTEYGDFIFGNVLENDLSACKDSDIFARVSGEIANGVELCRASCEYFNFCGGGAPSNKYFEKRSFRVGETLGCRFGQQIPLEVTIEFLQSTLLKGVDA